MRIIALEEHFAIPRLLGGIAREAIVERGWPSPQHVPSSLMAAGAKLAELGAGRLAAMDAAGIDVQVLSAAGPGAELVPGVDGVKLATDYNDETHRVVSEHPTRFAAFAHLPMRAPEAAADELERTISSFGFKGAMINGTVDGLFLDDPSFEPLLARAEALDCPLYLHPNPPPKVVRDAYYGGLPPAASAMLSMGAWGWHAETAVHVLRLVLSGSLDRHPGLKLIIGHMGEGLPAMMTRFDDALAEVCSSYLRRGVSQTITEQVWVTTSGFRDLPSFLPALMTFGADRLMFGTDYPYTDEGPQTEFLRTMPVSPADREKISFRNAVGLLKI